jgi:hypothetical protein
MSQSQLKRLPKDDGVKTASSVPKKASSFEVDLEKQLQAWRENPSWDDQTPHIKVRNVLPCMEYGYSFLQCGN